jgi:co-chaperonin GroES (HSP10)
MSVVSARKLTEISLASAIDPKQAILDAIGDLSDYEVFYSYLLIGTYIRPEKTAGGIIRPDMNVGEDEWQSKCGLVLKLGLGCFNYEPGYTGQTVKEGDWIIYFVGDKRSLTINGTPCCLLEDNKIRMRITNPSMVF